jgi:hypothetical protein
MKWKAKGNFCHTKVQDVRAVSRSNYDACKAKRQPCVKGQGWTANEASPLPGFPAERVDKGKDEQPLQAHGP